MNESLRLALRLASLYTSPCHTSLYVSLYVSLHTSPQQPMIDQQVQPDKRHLLEANKARKLIKFLVLSKFGENTRSLRVGGPLNRRQWGGSELKAAFSFSLKLLKQQCPFSPFSPFSLSIDDQLLWRHFHRRAITSKLNVFESPNKFHFQILLN